MFELGELHITPGAQMALDSSGQDVIFFLEKHISGDWGILGRADADMNALGVAEGGRIMSVYQTLRGVRFYVITEADRSCTTFLLPEDY